MGRLALGLVLGLLLTVPAAAQEGGTLPPGNIFLTEALEVKAGETLRIGPGTSVSGPGNITVWGILLVNGTEGSPASLSVKIIVLGGGEARIRQARVWGVADTAIEVYGGSVELAEVLVENNTRAALVTGSARFRATDTIFRDHAGEAIYLEGAADVALDHATFSGNGRGATVYSASAFRVNDSTFAGNGQHLVIDLGPWTTNDPEIALARNAFRAPAAIPAALPSILLRHESAPANDDVTRLVKMNGNRIEGAPVGLRAEGRALTLESVDDTYVDNAIGLSVQLATVQMTRPILGNAQDVDGSGRITLDEPTYLPANGPPAPASRAGAAWVPYAIGAGGALALLGALVWLRMRARAPQPPPQPEPQPEPQPDLATPLTTIERRILEDVVANPGTAQRAVADRLGYTRQALHYHVKKLEARGLIRKTVEGRETRCHVPPSVASMLVTPVATRTGSHEKG